MLTNLYDQCKADDYHAWMLTGWWSLCKVVTILHACWQTCMADIRLVLILQWVLQLKPKAPNYRIHPHHPHWVHKQQIINLTATLKSVRCNWTKVWTVSGWLGNTWCNANSCLNSVLLICDLESIPFRLPPLTSPISTPEPLHYQPCTSTPYDSYLKGKCLLHDYHLCIG